MKKLMLSIILISLFTAVRAQRQNVYFLKNNGKEMKERDSADFIRIIQEPDSGDVNFKLLEYYPDGAKKTIGFTSKVMPVTYEGPYVSYNKEGKKIAALNYKNGHLDGTAYYFFGNGILEKQMDYSLATSLNSSSANQMGPRSWIKEKVIYVADSAGIVLVKDGNGHFIHREYEKNGEVVTEEGDYKDGLKNGIWMLKNSAGSYWYKEQFEQGKMLSGESYKDGKNFSYTKMESPPEFMGGQSAFSAYLRRSMKYPTDAISRGIRGKVFLSFVVDQNGRVQDIKVDRSVYPSIDQEAMRVIRESPRWSPGIQHGVPVRVKYNIPINFDF